MGALPRSGAAQLRGKNRDKGICCLSLVTVRADYIGLRPRERPRGHGEFASASELLKLLRSGLAEAPRRPRREAPETAEARRGARPLLNRRGAKYEIRC